MVVKKHIYTEGNFLKKGEGENDFQKSSNELHGIAGFVGVPMN